jgi:integrase/recombinase XerD
VRAPEATTTANEALIESWSLSLHAKAERTILLYLEEVRRFAGWLAAHGRPAGSPGDLAAVERRDVEAWIGDLRAQGLAQATVRSRWIALRSIYRFALEEGEIDASPLERVTVAKPNPPPPDVLADADIRALLRACEGRGFYERRDYALIRTMLATGLRASELCALTPDDVDLRSRVLVVRHGKGDRARFERFDPATAAALDRYRRARARHRLAGLPWLWVGHRGRLTRKGLPPILERRAAQAGIAGHIHAHQLRHTFAHRWLSRGGQEGDLRRLGGWEFPEIMRRYGEVQAVDRALTAYDEINPMGEL